MKKFLLLLAAGAVWSCCAAGPRFAVIDLRRVFKEYYKSRIAEDFIKQQAEAARSYLGQLTRQLETLGAEARRLETNARNMALDPAQRSKAESEAAEAVRKVRAKEAEIQLYARERKQEMDNLDARKRAEILGDIKAEIGRRAAAEGYDWVFDSSGFTTNDQPAVLLFPEKNDISAAVIRELNRGAVKPKK
ncbi:MAG: OmpH family outer membrane protein [Lentisphaeria bacterium]|nr:OmpH family outer membrane protein [Lentisphaeria bacterium]